MFKKKTTIIFLFFLLILAAILRLWRIGDYMTFLGDEGRDVLVVKRMIVDHKFTLLGPTASVGGFFLGPIYYYFMVPFLWAFGLNPVGPAVMVALFGVATVFLVYRAGKDFFGTKAGIVAATLYAVSPLVITYSRASWNPNLMPFFSLLIIWLVWKIVTGKRPKLLGVLGFMFGIAIQLHYLAVFLMVIVAGFLLLTFRKKEYLKYYVLLLGGFLLGWLPFILFELRHGFPNLQTLYRFIFFGKETGVVSGEFLPIVTDVIFRLFNRLITNNYGSLAIVTLLLSAIFLFWRWRSQQKAVQLASKLLFLWLVIGVGLFGFYHKGIYDYYFGFMYPLPFLLVGNVMAMLDDKKGSARVLAVFFFLVLLGVNLKGLPLQHTPNRQLAQTEMIARFIFDEAKGKPFNFALITGGNSDHAYRYFFEIWRNPPVTIENSQIDPERITVTDQLYVICETLPCSPLGHSLWEIAGFGRAEIAGEWQISVHKVYKLIHYQDVQR